MSNEQRKAVAALLRERVPARGRDRPPVRAPRPRARAGRRAGPGRLPRPAAGRPRPDHGRDARAGAGDHQRLGRPDLGGRDRVRHRRAAQGQHDLRDHHLPQRAVRAGPRASPTCGTARRWRTTWPRRDFTVNAMAARLPGVRASSTRSAASRRCGRRCCATPGRAGASRSAMTRCASCARPGSRPSWGSRSRTTCAPR